MAHESDSWDRQAARIDHVLASYERLLERHSERIVELAEKQIRLDERVKSVMTEHALGRYGIPLAGGGLGAALVEAILRLLAERGAL